MALKGSVTLSGGARDVGRRVRACFTITNSGGQPLALEGIKLAVRGPGGAGVDLVSDQAVTLAPGQPLAVTASWPLDAVGAWYGWIEVTQNGQQSLVGAKQAFAFWVSLPQGAGAASLGTAGRDHHPRVLAPQWGFGPGSVAGAPHRGSPNRHLSAFLAKNSSLTAGLTAPVQASTAAPNSTSG